MDGTSSDRFVKGQLFRPASLTQARDGYVDIVYKLARSEYIVDRQSDTEGVKFIALQNKITRQMTFIRDDDYKLCLDVVKAVGQFPLFPSEPKQDIFGRIKANINVIFANRNLY
jgi:hypothetical protein